MTSNESIKYYLKNAFDYEIKNYIDIRILEITNHDNDLSEDETDELNLLSTVKEYLISRSGALKAS